MHGPIDGLPENEYYASNATLKDRLGRKASMHSGTPQHIETKSGSYRCVRLPDGRFHLVRPGPMGHLFYGGDHILVSQAFADILRETCAHCVDLRRTELVQAATGETFGVYYEVSPHDEFTPDDIGQISAAGFHAWHFRRAHLFVSPTVAEYMQERGFDELSFSSGFSRFAGAAA